MIPSLLLLNRRGGSGLIDIFIEEAGHNPNNLHIHTLFIRSIGQQVIKCEQQFIASTTNLRKAPINHTIKRNVNLMKAESGFLKNPTIL